MEFMGILARMIDKPSSVREQLNWLSDAGFVEVDLYAIVSGDKRRFPTISPHVRRFFFAGFPVSSEHRSARSPYLLFPTDLG